jgi:hypothetical protein
MIRLLRPDRLRLRLIKLILQHMHHPMG